MRFVFVSYHYSADIHSPAEWITRLRFYIGASEHLATSHTVIRIDQINYTGSFTHQGVQYHCIESHKEKNYFPLKLHSLVKAMNPDIVIVSSLLFPLQVVQLRLKLGKKVKIIIQNHAEHPFKGIRKYIQRLADRVVNAYLFASYEMGIEWVSSGNIGSKDKIHEVMEVSSVFYPINKTLARSKTGMKEGHIFLWVGRLNNNKDPITVVKAFLAFARQNPGVWLYMIYQTTELLEDIKNLVLIENTSPIILTGPVTHADMLNWYNAADLILSGSHHEGSGTAICEAMSCGCIPVLTDIPSFRTITGHGQCGLLYPAGNVQALESALGKALKLDLKDEYTKSLLQYNKELSFEVISRKLEQIALSLLSTSI